MERARLTNKKRKKKVLVQKQHLICKHWFLNERDARSNIIHLNIPALVSHHLLLIYSWFSYCTYPFLYLSERAFQKFISSSFEENFGIISSSMTNQSGEEGIRKQE